MFREKPEGKVVSPCSRNSFVFMFFFFTFSPIFFLLSSLCLSFPFLLHFSLHTFLRLPRFFFPFLLSHLIFSSYPFCSLYPSLSSSVFLPFFSFLPFHFLFLSILHSISKFVFLVFFFLFLLSSPFISSSYSFCFL